MLSIDLRFAGPTPPGSRGGANVIAKSMLRPRDEDLGKTLSRIRMLCHTAPRGKGAPRMTQDQILALCPPAVLLDADGQALDEGTLNSEAWAAADALVVGDARIRVRYNLPTVTSVTPPSVMYAGLPAVCSGINILFGGSLGLASQWRLEAPGGSKRPAAPAASGGGKGAAGGGAAAGPAGGAGPDESLPPVAENTLVITPDPTWAGRRLYFRCRADRPDALWTEVETPPVVTKSEGFGPIARQDGLKPKAQPDHVRVATYNVLHDGYANTQAGLKQLYPFCTKEVMALTYRRARVVQELRAFDADVVCLQECGRDVFHRYYQEVFNHWGYTAHLAVKTGSTKEGCVIAYRRERFEPIATEAAADGPHIISLGWETLKRRHPEVARSIAAEHPHTMLGLLKLPSVGIAVPLRDRVTGKAVVVSNTHLYYHPDGCHYRILQTFMLRSAVQRLMAAIVGPVELIFAGDFNFTRTTGGYRLATTGVVMPDDVSWRKGTRHYWGMDKDKDTSGMVTAQSESGDDGDALGSDDVAYARDVVLQERRQLLGDDAAAAAAAEDDAQSSALVAHLRSPPESCYMPTLTAGEQLRLVDSHPTDAHMKYSNYSLGFKACIDHIFTTPGLPCVWTLRPPTDAELAKDVAIPSLVFPSDHVPLVADFAPAGSPPPS